MEPRIQYVRWTERPDKELEELTVEEFSKGRLVPLQLELGIQYRADRDCDRFGIVVVTPETLKGNDRCRGWKEHKYAIVVDAYDWQGLRNVLEQRVAACANDDWKGCLEMLKEQFAWQFDDKAWHPSSQDWLASFLRDRET